MIKQLLGFILLGAFLSFMGYKFYNTVKYMEFAGLIIFLAIVVLLVIILGIGRILKGY